MAAMAFPGEPQANFLHIVVTATHPVTIRAIWRPFAGGVGSDGEHQQVSAIIPVVHWKEFVRLDEFERRIARDQLTENRGVPRAEYDEDPVARLRNPLQLGKNPDVALIPFRKYVRAHV